MILKLLKYLERNGIKTVEYQTYPSGASWLGGLVESLVKQSKRLLNSSIQKRIMEFEDFEFAVSETKSLINKRPIAFKDSLRDLNPDSFALTPEMVIKGYSTVVMNIMPELQPTPDLSNEDKVWTMDNKKCIGPNGVLMNRYEKLRKVTENIRGHYHHEF